MKYSIILPVKNQEDHIAVVLTELRNGLANEKYQFEIIAVVNSTVDQSFEKCREVSDRFSEVLSIKSVEHGWGNALILGSAQSNGDILCFANSARLKPDDIKKGIEYFEKWNNREIMVKGNRKLRQGKVRAFASKSYNFLNKILHQIDVKDVNGTPKLISKKLFNTLEVSEKEDLFDLDIIYKVSQKKILIYEFDILNNKRNGGKSTTTLKSAILLYWGSLRLWGKRRGFDVR